MKKMTFRLYGNFGNGMDCSYDFSRGDDVRIIKVWSWGDSHRICVDITRNNTKECLKELSGQLSDGLFENYEIWDVKEVPEITDDDNNDNSKLRRKLDYMPFDHYDCFSGTWYHATGYEVWDEKTQMWWNEYEEA